MSTVFDVMRMFDDAEIYHTMAKNRPDSITISATMVGERLEVDVFEDGSIEFSRFKGNEDVESGIEALTDIIKAYVSWPHTDKDTKQRWND